jgi:HEAT repeat protein
VSRPTPFADADPVTRATSAAASGRRHPAARDELARLVRLATDDPDARVRAAAVGAVVRGAGRRRAHEVWRHATVDTDVSVRRRCAELAPAVGAPLRPLLALLADPEWSVAEAAAWAVGELTWSPTNRNRAVAALVTLTRHDDPLVREAAVAAIGSIGDPAGLPAVLRATHDRPAVRRRAVLALAPFEGDDVDAALEAALTDPDWQVRQAAEDLASPG